MSASKNQATEILRKTAVAIGMGQALAGFARRAARRTGKIVGGTPSALTGIAAMGVGGAATQAGVEKLRGVNKQAAAPVVAAAMAARAIKGGATVARSGLGSGLMRSFRGGAKGTFRRRGMGMDKIKGGLGEGAMFGVVGGMMTPKNPPQA